MKTEGSTVFKIRSHGVANARLIKAPRGHPDESRTPVKTSRLQPALPPIAQRNQQSLGWLEQANLFLFLPRTSGLIDPALGSQYCMHIQL